LAAFRDHVQQETSPREILVGSPSLKKQKRMSERKVISSRFSIHQTETWENDKPSSSLCLQPKRSHAFVFASILVSSLAVFVAPSWLFRQVGLFQANSG